MYAVVKSGGKQYHVRKGLAIAVDLLDAEIDSIVEFKDVLFFFDGEAHSAGASTLGNCIVKGKLTAHVQDEKVFGMKYKRRKQNFRAWGHRQRYSVVTITEISMSKKGAKHGT